MGFLHLLEQLRTPVLTAILSAITYCGDELFFITTIAGEDQIRALFA